jgi:hypothetical protein
VTKVVEAVKVVKVEKAVKVVKVEKAVKVEKVEKVVKVVKVQVRKVLKPMMTAVCLVGSAYHDENNPGL